MPTSECVPRPMSPTKTFTLDRPAQSRRGSSLSTIINPKALIHKPVKLKLYSALVHQNKDETLIDHFRQYRAVRLDREFEDKKLLKELFNWTDDAAYVEHLDIEIIVGEKFSMTNSANTTPRAGAPIIAFSKDANAKSQQLSFDEMLKSKYEAYKKNYDSKTNLHAKESSRHMFNPNKRSVFANRERVNSYESSEVDTRCDENYVSNGFSRVTPKGQQVDIKKMMTCASEKIGLNYVSEFGPKTKDCFGRQRDENDPRQGNVREAQIYKLKSSLNMWAN